MKPTVFISSSLESRPLAEHLKRNLSSDANVITSAESLFSVAQPPLGKYSESLVNADFVVFLVDLGGAVRTRGAVEPRARDNVIFELGVFIGRLGPDRVLVVDTTAGPNKFKAPTDVSGLTILRPQETSAAESPEQLSKYIADEVRRRGRIAAPTQSAETATYSCFISYSHHDESFASQLVQDLSGIGARCWVDRHELRVGESIADQIRAALLATDKFLAVFSAASLKSQWFRAELKQALELEAKRRTTVLVPIRIDDAILSALDDRWIELRDRLIADFRDWRSTVTYNRAFRQLALNLAASVAEDRRTGE
jgi:hypothetical protein